MLSNALIQQELSNSCVFNTLTFCSKCFVHLVCKSYAGHNFCFGVNTPVI